MVKIIEFSVPARFLFHPGRVVYFLEFLIFSKRLINFSARLLSSCFVPQG